MTQLVFTILMLLFFIYTAVEATTFRQLASYFPFYLSLLGIACISIEIIRQLINLKKGKSEDKDDVVHPNIRAAIKYMGLLVLYAVMVYVLGMVIASAIYVFAFLFWIARMKWWKAALTTGVLIAVVVGFADMMNLYWPKSLIQVFTIMF